MEENQPLSEPAEQEQPNTEQAASQPSAGQTANHSQMPVQPMVPIGQNAPQAEKEALFATGSSLPMIFLCIFGTVNLAAILVGKIISSYVVGILFSVLDILIVIGAWLTFANAKNKKLDSGGISLIRIPYVIQFIFAGLIFVGSLALWVMSFDWISLAVGIIAFVLQCLCFVSVNKTLKIARDINRGRSVAGRNASPFAAIMMIIFSVVNVLKAIDYSQMLDEVKKAFEAAGLTEFAKLIGGGGVYMIVVAATTVIVSAIGAVVIIQFGKKVKNANRQV